MKDLKNIVSQFDIDEVIEDISPLGEGLINDTYLVVTAGDNPDYVLQRINHNVFKNVDGMQRNIETVTAHIREKLFAVGEEDIERKVLDFVKVKGSGKTYYFDGENYWRLSRYIKDTVTLSEVTPVTAKAAGKAFGEFQRVLADIEEPLVESIPDFHNMEFRLKQLQEAVEANAVGRVKEVEDFLEELSKRVDWLTEPERMYRDGRLPKRICHCDTKVNNMLFDKDGNVLCVIDLDTVMPSFVFSDFGDFLRTGACTTAEDEPDVDKIDFNMDIFKAFAKGYLSEGRKFLTEAEIAWLPDAVALFPYMQAVRFLTDYINGDTYYKIKYPEHNLVRTKAQLRLLNVIEKRLPEIRENMG
ncbi:MAG: aminoglycoside phosphotransferase family protein [Muribaculaceae bacterium]|nr:aminoglycoside phosphotransferase family protein [Muribaculaceae bacterium]